jgi:hypothetical protein
MGVCTSCGEEPLGREPANGLAAAAAPAEPRTREFTRCKRSVWTREFHYCGECHRYSEAHRDSSTGRYPCAHCGAYGTKCANEVKP